MSPCVGRWPTPPPGFRTQGHSHPRSSLRCVSKAQSKGAWLFPKPAIRSPAWPAGLRGEIKEEAAAVRRMPGDIRPERSEEHKSELQSLMRISYAVFCLKKKNKN